MGIGTSHISILSATSRPERSDDWAVSTKRYYNEWACRGGYYVARHVANITCVVEWYRAIHGTPNVAAMIHRHMQRNE